MLSIITICKNNLSGLKKTIESLENQTYKNFELIIVDGNSKDATVEYLESMQHDEFMITWRSENDTGIYNAMNKGISLSRRKYLQFLNAGDTLYSDNSIMLASECINNSKFEIYKFGYFYKKHLIERATLFFFFKHMFNHQSMVYHKNCFSKYLYNEELKIVSDYEHLIKIIDNSNIGYFDFSFVKYEGGGIAEDRKNLSAIWLERSFSALNAKKSIKNLSIFVFSYFMFIVRKIWNK
jgi:glycosyltransferase involved in cell wall biosynthesis